ncbi:uncharacterized protein LOC131889281 [Tigriopus californicus]|uniref:uncharacterized protein LOC131889281 n=1 Tax=Tigriopus californicus TaxID=6832 RepID=UPI0027D9DEFC|nr:uncharacterized protein LOC131889281 [Tigriopus californicus]
MAPTATEMAVAIAESAMEAKEAKPEAVLLREEKYKAQLEATRAREDMRVAVTRVKEDIAEILIRAAEDQAIAIKARVRTENTLDVATAVDAVSSAAAMATIESERQVRTRQEATPASKREE